MGKILRYAFLVPALLLVAVPSRGADAVKLRVTTVAYSDGKGGALKRPEGVAFDGKSLLAVADTGNARIQLYNFSGDQLTPGAAIILPQLTVPIRVQIDSKGDILALDSKSHRIVRVTPSGAFKGYVEPSGIPTQGTVIPRSFKLDDKDNLYILDVYSRRVLVLDPSDKFQREIPFPPEYGFFSDIAVDGNGNVFLIDSVGGKVFSARKNDIAITPLTGSLQEDLNFPVGIAVDGKGRLYVSDQHGSGIVILGADGSFRGRHSGMGWREGLLRYPSALCVGANGNLFIADRGNSRVQVFSIIQ